MSVRGSTRGREDVYSALCFVLYWSSLIASINMVIVVVARDLIVVIVSIAMVELWRVARMMPQGAVVSTALVTGRETELCRFQISPDHGFHRRGDSSSRKAVAVTALVTGRRAELRRFQISPDHGFHRKCDSSSSKESAGVVTALVTGRRTELRRFQISPDHGLYRRGDSSSSRRKKIPQSRAPPERPPLDVEGESSPRRGACCRGGKRAWRHRPEWSVVPT